MVSFFCPFCKHVIKAAEDSAGTLITCEQCKLEIRVPHSAAPPVIASIPAAQRSQGSPSWWKRLFSRRGGERPSAS